MSFVQAPTRAHEAHVAERFDQLADRFRNSLEPTDVRLRALKGALGPLNGQRILDLGCGKGRFARALKNCGADVIGLDVSSAMLREAPGLSRVRASARRVPLASCQFDAVVAVEVIQHLPTRALDDVLAEARRALRPGGTLAIIDRNLGALDARRTWLPSVVLKRVDERRGRWMYPAGGPVRETWHWPEVLARRLAVEFTSVEFSFPRLPEERHQVFARWPRTRRFVLWKARARGHTS